MRTKSLLFLILLTCGALSAQDTIRTLVISEVRLDDARRGYVEIANVGTDSINLAEFELGVIGPWTAQVSVTPVSFTNGGEDYYMMLPAKKLGPNQTFVVAAVYDWGPEMFLLAPEDYSPFLTKREFYTLADIQLDFPESPTNSLSDSVHPKYRILEVWGGRDCIYLRHHLSNGDSVVIDQVNGIFDGTDLTSADKDAKDVAGIVNATSTTTLVRKFKIKQGNPSFLDSRGADLSESEWMPIPHQAGGAWADNVRRLFWTAGHHGDVTVDAATITSDVLEFDWTANTITVPWGIRRDDSVMFKIDRVPGLAWHYHYNDSYDDSASFAAKTGDSLTIYAAGNELGMIKFGIIVAAPTDDAAIVVPKRAPNDEGFFEGVTDPVYTVTDGLAMDTIGTAQFGGVAFATRVDTLQKYLEKAEGAAWEIVWNGGEERVDLIDGDILKVTAPDGTTEKEYYIKVDTYRPSHNAYLSSITWPDIPEDYKGIFGWIGDTVPNFVATKYNYRVRVPAEAPGIPHLVGKPQNINSTVDVDPAVNLYGSEAGKTVTFTTTAEDDTTIREYTVVLDKEIADNKIQPQGLEPFISQFVWQDQWANGFIEVANPNPKTIDMSNYMFCWGYVNTPDEAITRNAAVNDWSQRYSKYIPGYKWQDSTNWKIKPAVAIPDNNVFSLVQSGDVFVVGDIWGTGQSGYPWWASKQCDVILSTAYNPWNEESPNWTALQQWNGANWYLFRIDNDSITAGLKSANDPADFTLIDVFGSGDGSAPVVGGAQIQQTTSYIRKPEVFEGNPVFKGSFGTDAATSEWTRTDRPYYAARGVPWPNDILFITEDIGSHFMHPITYYKSTVSSIVYKVSDGYSQNETIRGLAVDTDVTAFFANLIKADAGQTLTVVDTITGAALDPTDIVGTGDTLIVVSQDMNNTTKYVVEVVDLSDDALLTSETYTIEVAEDEGTITGMDYGTTLKAVYDEIVQPAGATLLVVSEDGTYIPFKTLKFDTTYTDVQVSDKIYFDVTAENGTTKIVYHLVPNSELTDAFVISDVFDIDQEASLIDLLPGGLDGFPSITTAAFFANLIPAPGATLELVDKMNMQRLAGFVVKDDKLIVTAADGETQKIYYLKYVGDEEAPLAYVTSELYSVDQLLFIISGEEITNATTVNAFLANLIAAEGATVTVITSAGVPKTTGNLVAGDLLSVLASDGITENIYTIDVIVSTDNSLNSKIDVYPNPSKGHYYITGVSAGSKIRVTNILGATILEKKAVADKDEISLENQRSGIYFITITDNDKVVGRHKVVKE